MIPPRESPRPAGPRPAGRSAVRTLITTRSGGVSRPPFDSFNLSDGVADAVDAVRSNRAALADRLDLPADRIVWMHQVHGTAVHAVRELPDGPLEATDGLVTDVPGIALAVLVADCVPVLAADPVAGVIGAAHAGRRGAAGGIAESLIDRMVEFGAQPSRIRAQLGPAICGACYEVPGEMAREVERALPGSACPTAQGTPGLDLRAGLARRLGALGVPSIEVDSRCTREDPELFSHRRDAPTGRFAAVIRLEADLAPNAGVSQHDPSTAGR